MVLGNLSKNDLDISKRDPKKDLKFIELSNYMVIIQIIGLTTQLNKNGQQKSCDHKTVRVNFERYPRIDEAG